MSRLEGAHLEAIKERAYDLNGGKPDQVRDSVVGVLYDHSAAIAGAVVVDPNQQRKSFDERLDDILTSRLLGFPAMLILLAVVLWLTVAGANVPSEALSTAFGWLEKQLLTGLSYVHAPQWLTDLLVLGLYRTVTWVIAVMLPPMAIFFPIFALLEDFGYLPRVAFNLDRFFQKAGAHGKQALTMAMGLGCNAAGIIACRIIESPRERMIAILTNNFVPCNGRWPTLIILATLFMGAAGAGGSSTLAAAGIVALLVVVGLAVTYGVAWTLSKTLLKGVPSRFTLELPPYRKPQIAKTIVRSTIDKTIFVLKRAVIVAAPAGIIIWVLANIQWGDASLLGHAAAWLDPFARSIGLDGYILMAFILGLPANEIVLPILIMGYMSAGSMLEFDSLVSFRELLVGHGWNWLTALCVMLFSLLHYPCGTTLFTMMKETNSIKWTLFGALLPTAIAVGVCFAVTQLARITGLA